MAFWSEDLEAEYTNMTADYKPSNGVEVLLIGESPPETKGSVKPYFYNEKDTQNARLSDQLKNIMDIEGSKNEFLEEFAERGFYLIDIFPTYNALQRFESAEGERKAEMKKEIIERLTSKIVELEPDKIVFIHKGATKEIALPFPAYGNQPDFKEEFEQLIS